MNHIYIFLTFGLFITFLFLLFISFGIIYYNRISRTEIIDLLEQESLKRELKFNIEKLQVELEEVAKKNIDNINDISEQKIILIKNLIKNIII
jgi:hypothetical protein